MKKILKLYSLKETVQNSPKKDGIFKQFFPMQWQSSCCQASKKEPKTLLGHHTRTVQHYFVFHSQNNSIVI